MSSFESFELVDEPATGNEKQSRAHSDSEPETPDAKRVRFNDGDSFQLEDEPATGKWKQPRTDLDSEPETPDAKHVRFNDDLEEDDEQSEFEGYDDLSDEDDDNDHAEDSQPRKGKHTFYERTTRMAERSAVRTQFDEDNAFLIKDDDVAITRPASRVPGTFGRRNRTPGCTMPAYHKKISHDMDSDDEMMMNMREKGYTDQQISDRLLREGRARYDRKSVCTRIGRIRLAQAAHVDTLLEDGLKEWEFDDDNLLMQAYELADIEVQYDIERVRAWRFRKVSEQMRRLNKNALFSEKACRERYQALMNGTATIPTELDDDPDARRREVEEKRIERKAIREAEKVEKERKAALEYKIKEEARLRNAQKAKETAMKRAEKAQEKANRAMQRAAQHQMKMQRAAENKQAKLARLEEIKAMKAFKAKTVQSAAVNSPYSPIKVNRVMDFKTVTTATPDPRSYLSIDDLKSLCETRALSTEGRTVRDFVDRLQDADDNYNLTHLRAMVRSKGLNTAGTKLQMRYQLALNEARSYASFEKNLAAELNDDKNAEGAGKRQEQQSEQVEQEGDSMETS